MSQASGAAAGAKRRLAPAAIALLVGVALVFGLAVAGFVAVLVTPPPIHAAFQVSGMSCRVVGPDVAYVSFAVAPDVSGDTRSTRVDNVEVAGALVTGIGTLPADFDLEQASVSELTARVPTPDDDFWDVDVDDDAGVVVLRFAREGGDAAQVDALDLIIVTGEPEYRQPVEVGLIWEGDACRVGAT
jgi:hypothetical protein